jgi:succinyl-CoA synthetase beta subunit
MDLLEYQGKQLFRDHGVPTPDGQPAQTAQEALEAAEDLGYPVVIKAQVLIGGRGKAGGIKVANDREEAREHAEAILGMDIRGFTVRELYVEKASDISEEYYSAVLLDRGAKKPMVMLSRMGGMDVEEIAERDPTAIARVHVDPLVGFQDFHGRRLAFEAGIADDVIRPVGALLARVYETFVEEDAMLVEVNPLLVTEAREVVALDAKVTVDGNALYRHPDVAAMRNPGAEDPQEQMARERGLTYVKLDGSIGVLGNGAGLVMSTLDVVAQAGGRPANFLDAGGGSKAEAIVDAVEVILSDPKVDAVLFNIFGGITRCDEVARGLVEAFRQIDVKAPFVVRLDGTNDEEGRRIIAEADLDNVHVEKTMLGAAAKVVELATGGAPETPPAGEHPAPVGAATPDTGAASQAAVSGSDQAGVEAGGDGGGPTRPGAEPTR